MTESTATRTAIVGRTIDAYIERSSRVGYNYAVSLRDRATGRELSVEHLILAWNVERYLERVQESADRLELCLTVVDRTPSHRFVTGLAR